MNDDNGHTRVRVRPQLTHVLCIIDQSGSMNRIAEDVRGGFNSYREQLLGDGEHEYRMTVTLFHSYTDTICTNMPVADVPVLNRVRYTPAGNTALIDAVGETLTRFSREADVVDGDKVLVMIQTDGLENSSREWDLPGIVALMDGLKERGWAFIYAGQGPDAWGARGNYGLANSSVMVPNTSGGTRSLYKGMSAGTQAYARGAGGQSVVDAVEREVSQGDLDT